MSLPDEIKKTELTCAITRIPFIPPHPAALPPGEPEKYSENGRLYHSFRKGKYMLPCDEAEMDRMDIFHKFFTVARQDRLHSIPLTGPYERGPRILDLGTGTGIWAIDMGDKYPSAEILGVDLSLEQPTITTRSNIAFTRQDIESPWIGWGESSWDLIHMRMLDGSITSWPDIYQKIYDHLRPGSGCLEHVEIDMAPRSEDGALLANSKLANWHRLVSDAIERAYRPLAYKTDTQGLLATRGFVDIQEQIIKIPLNSWPADPEQKDVGRWYNVAFAQGLEAMSLAPLTRMYNWEPAAVVKLCSEVKQEIGSKKFRAYCNMHIWTARRPAAA